MDTCFIVHGVTPIRYQLIDIKHSEGNPIPPRPQLADDISYASSICVDDCTSKRIPILYGSAQYGCAVMNRHIDSFCLEERARFNRACPCVS